MRCFDLSLGNKLIYINMKKTFLKAVCALVLALSMTSCGTVGLVGAIYTGYTEPAAVTSNYLGSKVGQAHATSVLGIVAAGDAGIEKAAKKAGITKISHIDKEIVSILGLFTKVTYTVYGE